MISPTTKDVIRVIRTYIYQTGMTLTEFADRADVSKGWLSRLNYEDAEISLYLASRVLNVAGYRLVLKHQTQLTDSDALPIKTLTDEQIRQLKREKNQFGKDREDAR
jgi:transcriptional regulator with XRE-family HTH domain